jgi:hypothetical protein
MVPHNYPDQICIIKPAICFKGLVNYEASGKDCFYQNRLQWKGAVHTIVNRPIPFFERDDFLLAAGSDLR